jgi:hypothetical protein
MRFRSEVVIRGLQELEQEITCFRGHVRTAIAAFNRGDVASAAAEMRSARRRFEIISTTTMGLKGEVIPADGLGDTMDSLAELVIRATRMAIEVQLSDLSTEIRVAAARDRARAMFAGRFQNIDEVAAFIHDEFCRINGIWMRYRSGGERSAAASENRLLYRAAMRAAQRAVRDIGGDRDLAHFLREGVTRIEWPGVHHACAQIVAAISVNIDADADRQLLAHSPPVHPSARRVRR